MDDFDFNTIDVVKLNRVLYQSYGIKIKTFLDEFVIFVRQIDFILCELNSPLVSIMICNSTAIIVLKASNCSEKFMRLLRRRVGLNALEVLPMLEKYSVTKDKIVFYVSSC